MIVTLLGAALVSLSVLAMLRPLAVRPSESPAAVGAEAESRERLLRQLQDLDDDVATGKLDAEDLVRLREPVEREVAETLGVVSPAGTRQHRGTPSHPNVAPPSMAQALDPAVEGAPRPSRRRTWFVVVATATASVLVVAFLLAASLAPRVPGATLTGDASPGGPAPTGGPSMSTDGQATPPAHPAQLAAVSAAETAVRRNPKDPTNHLVLARAYAAASAPQLSTIEYLAVTRLDRANPEANAALALVALAAGQPAQGKDLVDTALAAHPGYPEALYARGLVELMGLGQIAAGKRDLSDYLAAAPYGSHRTTVQTLLAMIAKGGTK